MTTIIDILSSGQNLLFTFVIIPLLFACINFVFAKFKYNNIFITLVGSLFDLAVSSIVFFGKAEILSSIRMSYGLSLDFRVYDYSRLFIFLASFAFSVITLYCASWLKDKNYSGLFMMYLFVSLAMINGAFLSNNFGMMLFFWEGLLCTLFGILLINNFSNYKTAVKALTLSGFADLMLMLGIIITVKISGTSVISNINSVELSGAGVAGFVCLMLGSLGKAGCMPFHSWIPCAASDAPLPFMTFFPGALEKLVGFYLAIKTITEIYNVEPGSTASVCIMALGAVTLVCAVAMALVQKDMKKLLSYHAISQVGYMVLGIGTVLPVGIAGGMFHMFNNVIYKSALFMVAGIIESKTGTTDLRKISGLGKKMPVTMICFIICGLSIAGVPPFNGFYSKELIFDAALESNCSFSVLFYICALVGAFMTAVSFLKMGRAAFSGNEQLPDDVSSIDEKGALLKIPAVIMAALCIVFGIFNKLPIDDWFSVVTKSEESLGGWPNSAKLVIISVCVLLFAIFDHIYGCKKTGKPINAADHIHYAPVLKTIYKYAEKGMFDPYNWLNGFMNCFSTVCVGIEKGVSFIYDKAVPGVVKKTGDVLHKADNGSLSRYIVGVIVGIITIILVFVSLMIKY